MPGTSTDADPSISCRHEPSGTTRVSLMLDGRAVSRALIIPLTIHIGTATVRMDGIGGVETEAEHRKRGYSRRVLESALRQMHEGDAVLSTLYGISDYYLKFGYLSVGPEHTIRLEETPPGYSLPQGWKTRALESRDLPDVRRIYELQTRQSVGAVARSEKARIWSELAHSEDRDAGRVVEDSEGNVVAYALRGAQHWWMESWQRETPESFLLAEVFATGPVAADAVLYACRAWAAETGEPSPTVEVAGPPEGPVPASAMLQGSQFTKRYTRAGEFMGRTLGPARLLAALKPELDVRIRSSATTFAGTLCIKTDEGDVLLAISSDEIQVLDSGPVLDEHLLVVHLPQAELARLVFGGYPPKEVLARLPHPPDEAALDVISALFPQRYPHIYAVDRF